MVVKLAVKYFVCNSKRYNSAMGGSNELPFDIYQH